MGEVAIYLIPNVYARFVSYAVAFELRRPSRFRTYAGNKTENSKNRFYF